MQENLLHNQILTLENRKHFSLTGVTDVECSNDTIVKLNTNMGKLTVSGSALSIEKIDLDTGEFSMLGEVKKIEYKNGTAKNNFSSLFK